jgi:hypothetical protein
MTAVPIPRFRADGYLPEGVHQATEPEVLFQFGAGSRRRRTMVLRLRQWLELARAVGAPQFLVDGSFVTAKVDPGDIDAVIRLRSDFDQQVNAAFAPALELAEIITTRRQGDLFAAEDETDGLAWIEFFTRTREQDQRRKGIVEVIL